MAFPRLSTIDRVRREVERNALRARHGIRMATGIQRTDVGLSPKDVVWSDGRTELWHYRSEQVSLRPPLLIIYSLFNKSCILDLRPGNSVIEQLVAAGFDVSCSTGASPTSATPPTSSRTTSTPTSPRR